MKAFINEKSEISEEQHELLNKLGMTFEPAKDNQGNLTSGFYLKLESNAGYNNENLAPLKSAHVRQKELNDQLKKRYANFPDDFDPEKIEKMKAKYETANEFNREKELKELSIEAHANAGNEYKGIIKEKDELIQSMQVGMMQSAREGLYSKLVAQGWDKRALVGVVEQATKVEMIDNKAVVKYVDENGNEKPFTEGNGDQRKFNDDDFIKHLSNDEFYGRMIETQSNTGSGGEQSYSGATKTGITYIQESETSQYIEGLAAGTHEVR